MVCFRPLATSRISWNNLPADLLDVRLAGGDAAGIQVDQVVPALGQLVRVEILITGAAARP
jgi:hypothetical protein